jgi:deoxyinosine 3'endonuclease (endonuclease V)
MYLYYPHINYHKDPMDSESNYKKRQTMDQDKKRKWEREQNYIRSLIVENDLPNFNPDNVKIVAGVDISFSGKFENGACAGLLIYDVEKKKILHEEYEYVVLKEDYIPGFLAFR